MSFDIARIDVVLRDVELTPLAEERIERRVEKIRDRLERECRVHVALAADHGEFSVNIRLVLDGRELVGTGTSRENVIAAFDDAAARTERRIVRRYAKMKRTDRGIRGPQDEARMDRNWNRWESA